MIGVKWTGWDGSEWNLNTGDVHLTKGGVLGLNTLEAETFVQTTALIDGQRRTGWRANPRPILLPVLIGQALDELEWLARDRAWWNTMRPDKYGTLTITAPDGTRRYITARFVDDGGQTFDHDPTADRLSVAVIALIADDPWWYGLPYTQKFDAGSAPLDFFGGPAGLGPPFMIGRASSMNNIAVYNAGDVDVWPTYYIDGPAAEFAAVIDGSSVAGSIEILENQQLQVETAPDRQIATMVTGGTMVDGIRTGGTLQNVTRLLANVDFRPVPSGLVASFDAFITGSGKITLATDPRYFRAW